ncbi:MAG: peptidylprolyl isomerase [Spirochaetales bacterium]|nr:peptidylprolyl isomerase [Spirochaetales bacterium]
MSCDSYNLTDGLWAIIKTEKGDIVLKLEYEKAPLTVSNFVGLAEGTIKFENRPEGKFYDGLKFHRVVDGFVIQGGDPNGNGTGDPGYSFADEFHPDLLHSDEGVLSMANSGPNSNGSQFFITLSATPHLDGKHSVFGHVTQGMDVVKEIKQNDVIKSVEIRRVGEKAKKWVVTQESFDELRERIGADSVAKMAEEKRKQEEAVQAYKDEQLANIAKDSAWDKAKTTATGLKIITLKAGAGASPKTSSTVKVDYHGTFTDGSVFDSSYQRGEPVEFSLGGVIPGFRDAIMQMKTGAKVKVLIPPDQGYGFQDYGPMKGGTYLIFEIELHEIK